MGTEWLSNLEACLHKAETEACLACSGARWVFKRLILAMSWLVKCVEIICDSGQRVSCGRGGHTRLAHTSAPEQKKFKKKKKQRGWHQLWTKLFNRSVDGSRNLEKPLNSPSGGLDWCVYVCKRGSVCIVCISIRDLFEFGRSVLSVLFRHCEGWGLVWSSLHK